MSDVIHILKHSLRMVFHDLPSTLRATQVGLGLIGASVILIALSAPEHSGVLISQTLSIRFAELPNVGLIVVAYILMFLGYLMMIAAWHRYVLLPEDQRGQGFTPSLGIAYGYLVRSILLGLLIGVLAIPAMIPAGILANATGSAAVITILAIPVLVVLWWIFFRLSLILPACTIERNMTGKESWKASAPYAATIFGLVILLVIANAVLNFALSALPLATMVGALISVVVSVLSALVSASILTTVYGLAVEGRQI